MNFIFSYILTLGCFAFNLLVVFLLQSLDPTRPQPNDQEKTFMNAFVCVSIVLLGVCCYLNPDLMNLLSLIIFTVELLCLFVLFILN